MIKEYKYYSRCLLTRLLAPPASFLNAFAYISSLPIALPGGFPSLPLQHLPCRAPPAALAGWAGKHPRIAEERGLLPTREPGQGCAEWGGGFRNLGSPPSPWRTMFDSPRHPLVLCLLTHPRGEASPPRWRAISRSIAGGGRSFSSPCAFPGPNKTQFPAVAPGSAGQGDHRNFAGRPPAARRGALQEGKSGAPSGSKQKINPPSSLPPSRPPHEAPRTQCLPASRNTAGRCPHPAVMLSPCLLSPWRLQGMSPG